MVIIQIQAHSPQNTQTYMKKKGLFVQKANLAKLLPHQMTGASHAPSRGSARIQINNLPCIFDFFLDDLILFGTLPATKSCCFFYHQDAVFERNLFHNGHKQ